MIFSIVKAPCAAPMILVLLSRILIDGTVQDLSLLLVFGAGVLTPFLGVAVIGGYASSSRIREYRDLIRAGSGILLIGLGLWIKGIEWRSWLHRPEFPAGIFFTLYRYQYLLPTAPGEHRRQLSI